MFTIYLVQLLRSFLFELNLVSFISINGRASPTVTLKPVIFINIKSTNTLERSYCIVTKQIIYCGLEFSKNMTEHYK